MSLLDRIGDCFRNNKAARATLLAGGAVGAYALGMTTPDVAQAALEGFNIVLAYAPQLDVIAQSNTFINASMEYIATVGTGLSDWAASAGLEVSRGVREALVEMHNFLGDGVQGAKDLFHTTISTSSAFLERARIFAGQNAPRNVFDAGKMIVGGLAAASGAWEGMKLVRAGFNKLFGTSPDPAATEAQNIQVNISINGGLVSEAMADQVSEAISEQAPVVFSDDTVASTREALKAAARRAAAEKAMEVAAANDNSFEAAPRDDRTSANRAWNTSDPFDEGLAQRVNSSAASDRPGAPLRDLRDSLEGFNGGSIHPRDLQTLSGRLKWLIEHEIGPRMEKPAAGLPAIDGGLILRVIPRNGGPARIHRDESGSTRDNDDAPGPSC